MDHMMPSMDGIETVRIIRGTGYSGTIVALTANAIVGQAEVFLSNSFDDFISKPIDMRILDGMLNTYIVNKQPPEVIASAQTKKEIMKSDMPFDISGLNSKQGLAFFDGDLDKYIQAVESFIKNASKIIINLQAVTEGSLPEYAVNSRSLKSISGWICADGIRVKAAEAETFATAGDLNGVIGLNGELIKQTEFLIAELHGRLAEIGAGV
jgi:CheY-like chemotaxis protein